MDRIGVTNKNILAKFVTLAKLKEWPVAVQHAEKLKRDKLFPKFTSVSIGTYGYFYQVEKQNGNWQIQRVDYDGAKEVSNWMGTRKFETMLDNIITIQEIEKRNQGD